MNIINLNPWPIKKLNLILNELIILFFDIYI